MSDEHLRALARSSALTLAGAVASTVAGFGLVLLVGRTLPSRAAGSFFAATAVFVLAQGLAGLGTDAGLARFVLRDRGTRGGVPALLRAAAVPVGVAALALMTGLTVLVADMRPLAWALPAAVASDFCLAATRAYAVFRPTVVIDRLLRPVGQVAAVAVVIAVGGGAGPVAAAWAAPYAVAAVLATQSLRAVADARGAGRLLGATADRETRRAFWSFTWPRAVARIAQIVIQRADIVLVAWLLGPTQAALYTVATRFVVFGQLANQAVSSVVQPRFTAILVEGDRAALRRVFTVATAWSVLLAWPVYACVAASPHGYLGWFGGGYVRASTTWVALTMAVSMLVAVASGPVDTLLLMAGRSGLSLANNIAGMVVDVGLCLVLIPRVGILGAALAWGVAVTLRCVLGLVQVRAELGLWPDPRVIATAAVVPVVCVALPVAAVDRVVGLGPAGWLVVSAVAVAAYLAVTWRLRRPLCVDVFVEGVVRRRREPVGAS